MKRPKGVLFDLDDTLLDRKASIDRYSAHFARDFADQLYTVSIEDIREIVQHEDGYGHRLRPEFFAGLRSAVPWETAPPIESIKAHWNSTFLHHCSVLRDGAVQVLEALRNDGRLLGIVTNGEAYNQHAKIDATGLRAYMQTVIVSGEAGLKKPDRGIFEMAVDRLGIHTNDAWYVGDSPEKDVWGAAQAGLTPVWIRAQFPWPPGSEPPALQIEALDDLLRLLSETV